jgi:hypothetical protein
MTNDLHPHVQYTLTCLEQISFDRGSTSNSYKNSGLVFNCANINMIFFRTICGRLVIIKSLFFLGVVLRWCLKWAPRIELYFVDRSFFVPHHTPRISLFRNLLGCRIAAPCNGPSSRTAHECVHKHCLVYSLPRVARQTDCETAQPLPTKLGSSFRL